MGMGNCIGIYNNIENESIRTINEPVERCKTKNLKCSQKCIYIKFLF